MTQLFIMMKEKEKRLAKNMEFISFLFWWWSGFEPQTLHILWIVHTNRTKLFIWSLFL